ncbi:MAG: PAS domain S-box protein [bacterium]
MKKRLIIRRIFCALAASWSIIIVILSVANKYHLRQIIEQSGINEARSIVNRDMIFRSWGMKHGHFMTSDNRCLTELSGYKIKSDDEQFHEYLGLKNYNPHEIHGSDGNLIKNLDIEARLISAKSIDVKNLPDDWEKVALETLNVVKNEASLINGENLRYLRALRIDKSCLSCHGKQGYRVGDIGGAISVKMQISSWTKLYREYLRSDIVQHVFIWLVGLIGLFFTYSYISKQEKIAEKNLLELTESEERFRTLFDNAPYGIATLDREGKFLTINDEYLLIVGRSRAEVLSMHYNEITYGSDDGISEFFLKKLDSGDQRCIYEKRYVHVNGEVIWVRVSASALRDKAGQIIHFIVVVENIQNHKTLEEALRRKEQMLLEAQQVARLGYWEYCPMSNDFTCSVELRNILECEHLHDKCNLNQIMLHVHPDDRHEFELNYQTILLNHEMYECDLRLVMTDGRIKHIHQRSLAYVNDAGQVYKVLFTFIDVTAIKRSEEAMIRAQKIESIGTLAGGIAHDFNNFLTVILGNAELLDIMAENKDKVLKCAERIKLATSSAAKLSLQLLTFAKGGDPAKKLINLNKLVSDTIDMVAGGLSIKIDTKLYAGDTMINLDEGQLAQVLSNLVINASQAMPSGGEIKICVNKKTFIQNNDFSIKRGDYFEIKVIDTGIGMTKDELDRIFDPYFTTKKTGHGIGLFVVYSIVTKHCGYIFVDSIKNSGTTFTIYLPVDCAAVNINTDLICNLPLQKRKLNIMVMDDDLAVGQTICLLLESLGCKTQLTPDGNKMLESVSHSIKKNESFDLFFMDLTVPGGMGGAEAIKLLLKLDPTARAVVYSGYSNDQVMSSYSDYGFWGRLAKPISIDKLNELLKRAC